MASSTLENLRADYESLFASMTINDGRRPEVDSLVDRIVQHRSVYEAIMKETLAPWQIIGIFHDMESRLNFGAHLHNGDPLTARTVHAPAGRPKTGKPPFTFAESAVDALQYDSLAGLSDWALAETLFRMEKYNGFGYRAKKINTPYLWSYSNHYTAGKFIEVTKNGKIVVEYHADLVSEQIGAAVLLRRMLDREIFSFVGLPRGLNVFVDNVKQPDIPAFLQKGNSWIAPRPLSLCIKGLSVAAVNNDPFRITVGYQRPGAERPEPRAFDGQTFNGQGHVDASDLIRDFLGMGLDFDDRTTPNRLLITTP